MSQVVTVKQLLEAGVHFGHHTNKWNPKMAPYIFTDRNKVYIINLEKTLGYLKETAQFLASVAEKGGTILFVGTKRQAQNTIQEVAEKTDMPYVNQRWLGGMLTNFETVKKSIARLDELEKMEVEGTYSFFTKKEVLGLTNQRQKLIKILGGVRKMKGAPDAIFVVDPKQEEIAVKEARKLGIPVCAIIDTNCDPDMVDHPIPGNDDAIRSVKLICEVVGDAIYEGHNKYKKIRAAEEDEITEEDFAKAAADVPATEAAAEKPVAEEASAEKPEVKEAAVEVPVAEVVVEKPTETKKSDS